MCFCTDFVTIHFLACTSFELLYLIEGVSYIEKKNNKLLSKQPDSYFKTFWITPKTKTFKNNVYWKHLLLEPIKKCIRFSLPEVYKLQSNGYV